MPSRGTPDPDGSRVVGSNVRTTTPRPGPGPGPHTGLARNVVVLSWVSFFADAASEMLYPVFPTFVTQTLGASPAVLGLIEGVAEGTASIGKAISGRLADRFRRRPMIAAGYAISTISKPLIGLARTWPLALVGRFVDRSGKGVRDSPRDAVLASDTSRETRGRGFGFQRAFDTAGAVVGPLLGLALYEAFDHRIRPLFFFAVIPGAISVGLVFLVRERPRNVDVRGQHSQTGKRQRSSAASMRLLPRRYRELLLVLGAFNLANFSDSLLILRAKEVGLSFVSVILVYALFNASYAALSYPAGILSDRIPRRNVYATGLLVFAVAYVGLGLTRSSGWVWVLFAVYGGYWALTDGVGRAWVADLTPPELVGTGLGLYQGVIGVGVLIAGVWAGLAWGDNGRLPLILSGSVVAVLATGLLTIGRRLDPPAPASASRAG
jgi:MFS family permease